MRKQLVTEAMADILAKETKEVKRRWLNFICCRMQQRNNANDDDNSDEEEDKKVGDEEAELNKILDNLN